MTNQPDHHSYDFRARFDVPVCDTAGGRRHLILELRTPPAESAAARQPLDLVFVVDASGSMSGAKLEAVKSALLLIGESLREDDRVSLVSFANDVRIHLAGAGIRGPGRAQFVSEIAQLHTRGNTNLSGGWLAGVELALSQTGGGRRRSLLLLSDGQANEGVVDPRQLARLASETALRGVATTCIGVGADYSTVQLGVISDSSGGRFHHADTPEAIVEVLTGELGELAVVAAEQLELELLVPQGLGVQVLSGAQSRRSGRKQCLRVGAAYRGQTRTIVVAVDAPARGDGFEAEVQATLAGRDATGAPLLLEAVARLAWGEARGLVASEADALLVAQHMSAWLRQQALNHNESGNYHAVRRLSAEHLRRLREQVAHAPSALSTVEMLADALMVAERGMDAGVRKQAYVTSRKQLYQERDLRRGPGDLS